MKRTAIHFAGLIALLAAGRMDAIAATNSGVARTDRPGHEFVELQNIFDASRGTNIGDPPPVQPRVDALTLTGILTSGEGHYAFFEGNVIQRRRAVFKPADRVDGFTIAEVTGDGVRLEAAGKPAILLSVGMQLTRQDEGPWKLNSGSPSGQQP